MKAAVFKSYGPPQVLKIDEIDSPSIQEGQDDRVLIRVSYASVNPFDIYYRTGFVARLANGFRRPKQQILGIDVSGTVAAVGKSVNRFKVGDAVFGSCLGSHAEYVRARESAISMMPKDLTFKEAAAIPTAALTALQTLRDAARIKKDQTVLIYGASGGIGHFAVQIAKFYETEVTAVCSTVNLQWVKELGADYVIDYTKEDFAKNGKKYDIILDAVGKRTFFSCRGSLSKTGVYITENPIKIKRQVLQILLSRLIGIRRVKMAPLTKPRSEDLAFLSQLIEERRLRPVIETTYALDQIAEAHRHLEKGHTKGKIVIEVRKQ